MKKINIYSLIVVTISRSQSLSGMLQKEYSDSSFGSQEKNKQPSVTVYIELQELKKGQGFLEENQKTIANNIFFINTKQNVLTEKQDKLTEKQSEQNDQINSLFRMLQDTNKNATLQGIQIKQYNKVLRETVENQNFLNEEINKIKNKIQKQASNDFANILKELNLPEHKHPQLSMNDFFKK